MPQQKLKLDEEATLDLSMMTDQCPYNPNVMHNTTCNPNVLQLIFLVHY